MTRGAGYRKGKKIRVRAYYDGIRKVGLSSGQWVSEQTTTCKQHSFSEQEAEDLRLLHAPNVSYKHWTRMISSQKKIPSDSIASMLPRFNTPIKKYNVKYSFCKISVLPPFNKINVSKALSDYGFLPGDMVEFKTHRRVHKEPMRECTWTGVPATGCRATVDNSNILYVRAGTFAMLMGPILIMSGRTRLAYVNVAGWFGWTTLSSFKKVEV